MRLTLEDQSDGTVRIPYEVALLALGDLLRSTYGIRVYEVDVRHDETCPKLIGGECNCHYLLQVDIPD